ncbi:MAG: aminotransferase class I/II-fold pyridoxal phosphate-dependent enzyme [Phototrophicaceae bacterium]
MASQTIVKLLQQHQTNSDLNRLSPATTMQDSKDLSADTMRTQLDEQIIAEASKALEEGNTHYVDVPGIAPLRESIADYLNQQYKSNYEISNMLVTAGVQESRFLTIQMISDEFDNQIAVPEVVHPGVLKAIGMRPRTVQKIAVTVSESALPSINSIKTILEAGSRLIYLESPSRLTGEIYTKDDVKKISNLALEYNASIIWDQGLESWTEMASYVSLVGQDNMSANVIAIGEAWSGMGLASWFIGYIAAPKNLIPAMQSIKQVMSICTSTPTQFAALEASKLFEANHATQLQQISASKHKLIELAGQANLEVVDGQAANILAFRLSGAEKDRILKILASEGYQVTDGSEFGAPDLIRINVNHTAEHALQALI